MCVSTSVSGLVARCDPGDVSADWEVPSNGTRVSSLPWAAVVDDGAWSSWLQQAFPYRIITST